VGELQHIYLKILIAMGDLYSQVDAATQKSGRQTVTSKENPQLSEQVILAHQPTRQIENQALSQRGYRRNGTYLNSLVF
jgi:hypothetical protein